MNQEEITIKEYEAPEIDVVETEYDLASYYETAGGLPPAAAAAAAIVAAVYSKNCAW
jgi:hypothetical protein